MARYGAGASRSGINTANVAYFNLDQTGTASRLKVVQVVVNIAVAPTTAPSFYLSRATVRGTQASTVLGQAFDPADPAALGTLDVCGTGASQPTFSTSLILATGGLAVTAGGAFVWTFYDSPIVVGATAGLGLVVANANASGSTTGTFAVSYLWEE
jgi:hypothetical protein